VLASPQRGQQLLLADVTRAIEEQITNHLKDLGLHHDAAAVAGQRVSFGVELERTEHVAHDRTL